jgi:hypothetical protein
MASEAPAPLAPEETIRLTEFVRAFKAAARAVVLYPAAHPAITATLGRVATITSTRALPGPLTITVVPGALLVDGRAPARPDPAMSELADLLHTHLIGELTVHPGGDAEAWRSFLLLLGRSPESVRADGGIARLWITMGGRHVELREIDYAEVLRERAGGESADWARIVESCLQGDAVALDGHVMKQLMEIAGAQAEQLPELLATVERRARESGGVKAPVAALMRMFKGLSDMVAETEPEQVEVVLRNIATALGQVSPSLMLELIAMHRQGEAGQRGGGRLIEEVMHRMSDQVIARFVAKSVVADQSASGRLAEAFHALVPETGQQQ